MITAVEARRLANNLSQLQLAQIEQGIKESIIMGGTCIYYKTDKLEKSVVESLRDLGYKVQAEDYNSTKISWEDEDAEDSLS